MLEEAEREKLAVKKRLAWILTLNSRENEPKSLSKIDTGCCIFLSQYCQPFSKMFLVYVVYLGKEVFLEKMLDFQMVLESLRDV